MTDDAEVAVVGYGPVSNTLAVLLGQLGRSVVVLERRPEPYPLPRAVHFDHEVGRILQSCGIGTELRRITEPADVYEWRNGTGTTLLRFGLAGHSSSGWPLSSMFNQPAPEDVLDRRARSLPGVEIRRGVEVVSLEQTPASVTLRTAKGGEVRARYVVGCDGPTAPFASCSGSRSATSGSSTTGARRATGPHRAPSGPALVLVLVPPPIGLTAAALFAGAERSRLDSRVRSPARLPRTRWSCLHIKP